MKSVKNYYIRLAVLTIFVFGIATVGGSVYGQETGAGGATRAALLPAEEKTIIEFEVRAKAYAKLRERIERKLPKLPKDASFDQIEAHKVAFQKAVREARRRVRHGEIFTPAAVKLMRTLIKNELDAAERAELREKVLEGETKGVPLKINSPYPDDKELVEMPPTLLLVLPQLPKQLRYRFVRRHLLLVDRENGLIVDYMTDALP